MGDEYEEEEFLECLEFEDEQTKAQLKLVDDLRKLDISDSLDLPQLVVVGDQSTGKSSVLQAVTEIPFPVHDSMCTRFATEIVLERSSDNDSTTVEISIIPGNEDSSERKETLLKWRPEGTDHVHTLDKATMENIFTQANNVILEDSRPKPNHRASGRYYRDHTNINRLSNATLRITRHGPQETNFAIVDIPGLVRGDENDPEHKTARKLVEKYFANPRSIIVVVIDIVDWERHGIFQILKKLPNVESRVIGVVNKCDTKQKKSHDFVFDLIRNANSSESKCYLKAGWYGLRNRQASESDITNSERDKLEDEFFKTEEWRSLDPSKLGRHNLKKALIKMRNNHIHQSIPGLLTEIQTKLDLCNERISRLGEPRDSNHAQYTHINKIATKYSSLAFNALEGRYEELEQHQLQVRGRVRDKLDTFITNMDVDGHLEPFSTAKEDAEKLKYPGVPLWLDRILEIPTYKWIFNNIEESRGKEFVGEVNPGLRRILWKRQTQKWERIASAALRDIEETVEAANAALFEKTCPDEHLRAKIRKWLSDDFQKASDNALSELKRIVDEERSCNLFTTNPYMVNRQEHLRIDRTQAIMEEWRKAPPEFHPSQGFDNSNSTGNHDSPIQHVQGVMYSNPYFSSVLNTHDTLAAYYETSKYRFMDNVSLQVIERHLLGPEGPLRLFNSDYVSRKLYGDKNKEALDELASEDPQQIKERNALYLEKDVLEKSRRRVQDFQRS